MSIQRREALLAAQCVLLGAWIAGEWWRWRLKPVIVRNTISHCHFQVDPSQTTPVMQFGEPS